MSNTLARFWACLVHISDLISWRAFRGVGLYLGDASAKELARRFAYPRFPVANVQQQIQLAKNTKL